MLGQNGDLVDFGLGRARLPLKFGQSRLFLQRSQVVLVDGIALVGGQSIDVFGS